MKRQQGDTKTYAMAKSAKIVENENTKATKDISELPTEISKSFTEDSGTRVYQPVVGFGAVGINTLNKG